VLIDVERENLNLGTLPDVLEQPDIQIDNMVLVLLFPGVQCAIGHSSAWSALTNPITEAMNE
jgi:hypothetical protein